jgi:hypothetical protein
MPQPKPREPVSEEMPRGSHSASAGPALRFLLSHAQRDDPERVTRFYQDLGIEVRLTLGADTTEEVGFLDSHSIQLGSSWSSSLVHALATCQTFIALCSPGYFKSVPCGREWWVFAERLRRHESETGCDAPALVPLVWVPTTMHPVAMARQHYDDAFGVAYRRHGLRRLMMVNRRAYLHVVSELARRIVETGQSHDIPHYRAAAQFDDIPSAFEAAGGESAVPRTDVGPRPRVEPVAPRNGGTVSAGAVSASGPEPGSDEPTPAPDYGERMEETKNWLLKNGQVHRLPRGGTSRDRPILDNP